MENRKLYKLMFISVAILLLAPIIVSLSFAQATAKEYKWKLSNPLPAEWQISKHIDEYCAAVRQRTKGVIEISHYPGGQLGAYEEAFTIMKHGGLDMLAGVPDPGHDPRLNVAYIPYLVENYDQVNKLCSPGGFLWKNMADILNGLNVKLIGFLDTGFFEVANNKRPIRTIDDMKGLKIRIMRIRSQQLCYDAFRASGIPMDFGELLSGLQTGVVDGDGSNGAMIHYLYLKGLIKYVTPLHHFYESGSLMMNLEVYNSLPKEYKKILEEEGIRITKKHQEWVKTSEADFLQKMRDAGIQVEELSETERKGFRDAGRSVWPQLEELIGKSLMDEAVQASK